MNDSGWCMPRDGPPPMRLHHETGEGSSVDTASPSFTSRPMPKLAGHGVDEHRPKLVIGHELLADLAVPLHPVQHRTGGAGLEHMPESAQRVGTGLLGECIVLGEIAHNLF